MTKPSWRSFLRSKSKEASKNKLRLQVEALEDRHLMATGVATLPIDFGKFGSVVVPGTIALSKAAPYSPTLGYGWETSVKATAQAISGPRQRSSISDSENNFRVDLPNGLYHVTVAVGDPRLRNRLSIWAEGQPMISGQRGTSRQFVQPSFQVAVTDRQLNLKFANNGKTRLNLKPNALTIQPILLASAGVDMIAKEGDKVTFAGQTSAGAGATYAWDFGDGEKATGSLTPEHIYRDNKTYTATLLVTDASGATVQSSTTVNVANVAPTASIGGPYTATAGKALSLAGSATDPSPIDTAAGFIYTWNFGDGTPNISGKGLTNPSHVYAKPGTYTVLVFATDKDNATSSAASTTVNVAKPPDPILTASAGGPYSSLEGATQTFTAIAAGGNGVYTYTWDLDNSGSYKTVGQTVASTFLDNGTYIVNLRVTDSAGQVALASATVNVANVAPTASIGGPYTATAGKALSLAGSATDPSPIDTAAGFIYTWNFGDGTPNISGKGLTNPSHVYAKPGTYTVLVSATDKDNATSSAASTTVNVAKPPDPILTASAGGPYSSLEGATQTFTAIAAGGNGVYTYAWDLDNSGSYKTVGQTVASTFLDNGTYIVSLRVTDSAGQVALASATVNVANVAPTASISGPYTATAGKALTLAGSATDPSPIDTAAGFIYTWNFGDGTPNISGKGLTNPSHVYAKPGTYTVLVSATDKDNATSSAASTTVNVAKPPDPILTASAGGPYSSLEGATQTFTAIAAGGNGVYTYAWDLDNSGSYKTVGQTVASTFLDNGTYIVSLRVTDSAGQVALASATVNVANVAPTVFGSGSYSAFSGQTLTLHASATDPSPVDTAAGFIYTWDFGDGSAPISGLGLTSPSHVYTTAGEYTATVTATDKDGGVSPMIFTLVTIFSLSPVNGLANLVLTPGWATFGQVLPQGVAHDALQLGNLVTQTDVKTTWPDGSIRYAIVSAAVPATGTYVLTEATPRVGSFTPTIPDASVRLTIGGVLYTATLPKAKSSDLWLNGPLVTEWRTTVAPVDPAGKPHPFLRVIFDTRSYQNGPDRLDVTVENVLDVAGATKVDYDVNITAGGQTLFSQAGVTQYYLTRWRKVFDLGLNESQVTHDFEPFYEAGALPRYLDTITNQTYSTTGDTFNILGRGGNTYDAMGAAGGRPELAPYPDWAAQYLVYQTASQQDYTLANGTLAGSWPVHIREADGSLVSIDNRPNFWLDTRGQGPYSYVPVSDQPKGDLTAASTGPLTPDLAHVPSLAYIPYLVTGDRYLADEVAFWGNIGLIKSWQAAVSNGPTLGGRGGALGIVGTEQVRARAWALRNLVDAAAYLPNADPTKNYFGAKVKNNLDYYNTYAQNHVTPLGTVFEQPMYTTSPDVSVWMNNYLAWSIDHANEQGFTGGLLLRNRIVDFQLKLFTSSPAYAREQAAPYYLTVGRILPGGTWEYFATMDDLFKQNFGTNQSTERPFTGYYGTDARITLILAANQGLPGAQEAYDWLTPQILSDIKSRSGWAIAQKKPQ